MEINFRKDGTLEIENARIIWKNFKGEGTTFNREGDRNFAVIIPDQEIADALIADGWNVKIRKPSEGYEDDGPFMFLKVKVSYAIKAPGVYVESGDSVTRLHEDTVGTLDSIIIKSADMDISPYNWERNGDSGKTAYLQSIRVIQDVDRFGARYRAEGKLND